MRYFLTLIFCSSFKLLCLLDVFQLHGNRCWQYEQYEYSHSPNFISITRFFLSKSWRRLRSRFRWKFLSGWNFFGYILCWILFKTNTSSVLHKISNSSDSKFQNYFRGTWKSFSSTYSYIFIQHFLHRNLHHFILLRQLKKLEVSILTVEN